MIWKKTAAREGEPRVIRLRQTPYFGRDGTGEPNPAKTVNVSTGGVLLRPANPLDLAIGDEVSCDIDLHENPDKALPFWGVGTVVRLEGDRAGIELKAAVFDGVAEPVDSSESGSHPGLPDSPPENDA